MRTARLSSRLLGATPSLASSASSRAGRLRSRTRRVGSRSPKSPRGGRMTHRAEAPGSRGRRQPISEYSPPNRLVLDPRPGGAAARSGPGRRLAAQGGSRVGAQPTAQPVPWQHESTIHLFAHALGRMMSCSIVDDPKIVEGGRPNQKLGPKRGPWTVREHPHWTSCRGDRSPRGNVAPDVRLARWRRRAGERAAGGPDRETRRSRSGPAA